MIKYACLAYTAALAFPFEMQIVHSLGLFRGMFPQAVLGGVHNLYLTELQWNFSIEF